MRIVQFPRAPVVCDHGILVGEHCYECRAAFNRYMDRESRIRTQRQRIFEAIQWAVIILMAVAVAALLMRGDQ